MALFPEKYYKESEKDLPPKSAIPAGITPTRANIQSVRHSINRNLDALRGNIPEPNLLFRTISKMTYGATPELIAHVQSLPGANNQAKVFAYIDEQLNPDSINDPVVNAKLNGGAFETLNKTRQQLFQEHIRRPDNADIEWEYHILPRREVHNATFVRAVYSNKQLQEMMVDFWHNHFNVYVETDWVHGMWVNYDRIMRENVFGNFRTLLEQMTQSMCMGQYLGNVYNEKSAPNENFARELLELHTLGAENYYQHLEWDQVPLDGQGRRTGYVEADVVELSRALTGWSVNGFYWRDYQDGNVATGLFQYRDDWHDKDDKRVLGQNYSFDQSNPLSDVQDILDTLCEHPGTAGFLAKKMCKRFISDNPSQSIIDQVADSLHQNWQAPDQIKLAMEVLLKSSAFRNTWGEKIKRPFERTVNAMRQMNYDFDFNPNEQHSNWHYWQFSNTGQHLFHWASPNGYPDSKGDWLSASSFMQTWRYMQWTSELKVSDGEHDPRYAKIVEETLAAFPNANDHTANNLVNYWFERNCGVAPDAHTQDRLADFMSYNFQNSNIVSTDRNAVINLTSPPQNEPDTSNTGSNDWPNYNHQRLRAMVAMTFMTAEFNYR